MMYRLKVAEVEGKEVKTITTYEDHKAEGIGFWMWKEGLPFEKGIEMIENVNPTNGGCFSFILKRWFKPTKMFELTRTAI
jgi:hypothetical protein